MAMRRASQPKSLCKVALTATAMIRSDQIRSDLISQSLTLRRTVPSASHTGILEAMYGEWYIASNMDQCLC